MVSKVTQKAPEVIFLETRSDTFETGSDILWPEMTFMGPEVSLVWPEVKFMAPEMT